MVLKSRSQSKFIDIERAEGQGNKDVFTQLARFLYTSFKNTFDDFMDNGIFKLNFAQSADELQLEAGYKIKRTALASSPYTVLINDHYIGVDTTMARTLNLPAAATAGAGKIFVIKDETGGAGANNITIDPSGVETVDGAGTLVINTNYGRATILCNGTNWGAI